MRSRFGRVAALVATVIFVVVAIGISHLNQQMHAANLRKFIDATPMAIEVEGVIAARTKSELLYGCGLGVLRMSNQTVEALKKEGLNYLASAKQARGHADPHWAYSRWQKTPIANFSPESRMAAAHDCFVDGAPPEQIKLANDIWRAARSAGGYYAYLYTFAEVLIFPESRLVVFVVNG